MGRKLAMETNQHDLIQLKDEDLDMVAGGQGYTVTTGSISLFGLALGTGGVATTDGNAVTATAGTNGVAVVSSLITDLSFVYPEYA